MKDRISLPALWILGCALGLLSFFDAHAAPSCYPFPGNTKAAGFDQSILPTNPVVWLLMDGKSASFVVSWSCDSKYQWTSNYFYGYRSDLSPNWQAILGAAPTMSKTDVDALWATNVITPDPALEVIAKRQLAASAPPPIVWRVKANPPNNQRPVYQLKADGTRNPTATADRVSVGDPCACVATALEEPISGTDSTNTYCAVSGLTNPATGQPIPSGRVSLCVRQ